MKTQLNQRSGRRWFGAAVVLVSVIVLVALGRPARAGAQVIVSDTEAATADPYEPNNTKGTASYIYPSEVMEYVMASIDPKGDQDFYVFDAYAGDHVWIRQGVWDNSFPAIDLTLFGGANCASVLARGEAIDLLLPSTGRYCIRARSADYPNVGGSEYEYDMTLALFDRFEPNDSPDQATPIQYGESIEATIMWSEGADYFSFTGYAGDSVVAEMICLNYWGPSMSIVGPDGVLTRQEEGRTVYSMATLPVDGTYYVILQNENYEGYATDCAYRLTLDKGIMVSPVTGGKIGSLAFDNDDVLLHFELADRWLKYFDPDAIVDTDITAITDIPRYYHEKLFVLKYPRTLCILPWWDEPCRGGWQSIQPHDVLSTFAILDWQFDGSDVGLSTAGEKIDALGVAPDGRLLLSTVGSGSVPGVGSFRDEDILAFTPTQWGADTAGTWELYFDGSTIPGLAVEDVTGVDVGSGGILYLSLLDGFTVGGVKCGPTCIIAVYPDGHVEKAWDGRDFGFGYKVDAFDFPGSAALMWP